MYYQYIGHITYKDGTTSYSRPHKYEDGIKRWASLMERVHGEKTGGIAEFYIEKREVA